MATNWKTFRDLLEDGVLEILAILVVHVSDDTLRDISASLLAAAKRGRWELVADARDQIATLGDLGELQTEMLDMALTALVRGGVAGLKA